MAKRRVFIIDHANTLNEQSQNALLKVLEEPPESVLFILITESKSSLLETIISRCILLSLTSPEKNEALEYIKSKTNFDEVEILKALENCNNNIGKTLDFLNGKEDSKSTAAAKKFLDYFLSGDTFGMLSVTIQFEKSRVETDSFFKNLKFYSAEYLRKKTDGFNAVSLSHFYSLICELEKSLNTNINLSLLFCTLTSSAEQIINNK